MFVKELVREHEMPISQSRLRRGQQTGIESRPSTIYRSEGGRMKKAFAVAAVMAMSVPAVALAAKPFVKVRPRIIPAGSQVTLSGTTRPRCGHGKRVTIFSRAFAWSTSHKWKGVPAVYAKVRRNHRWSAKVTISSNTASGRYRVTARCGAGTLGHTFLSVTGLY
jgi:hypothetical protein